MNSTVMPNSAEADDALAARADERLAHAYEQIARADEQLARLTEQLTRMEQDGAQHAAAIPLRRRSRGRPALRGLVGLLAAACIVGAAVVLQSSYGDAARPAIARWAAPYISLVSGRTPATPESLAQAGPPGIRVATAADAAPLQAAAAAGPQEGVSPASALASPDLAQLLQTMARDLATLQQGIEELKAGQERIAGDNAKAVEQVKATQEQMTRLVAKVSEQDQRTRTPAPLPQPVTNPARKPAPAPLSPQARAQPLQLQPAPR